MISKPWFIKLLKTNIIISSLCFVVLTIVSSISKSNILFLFFKELFKSFIIYEKKQKIFKVLYFIISMSEILDLISKVNFYDIINLFIDTNMYKYLFPFLLFYATLYSILPQIKIFRRKVKNNPDKTEPIKPIIIVVSFIVSLISVVFPVNDKGETLADFLMVFFPNVSTLTIGILCLFLVSTLLGKNFLDFFSNYTLNSYSHMVLLIIGFGSMLFYIGNFIGWWNYDLYDASEQWTFILMIGILIVSIILLSFKQFSLGGLLLFVFISYLYKGGTGTAEDYIIDPFLFIIFLFLVLFSWVNSDDEESIKKLDKKIRDLNKDIEKYKDLKLGDNYDYTKSRIYPIMVDNLKKLKKEYKKKNNGIDWKP